MRRLSILANLTLAAAAVQASPVISPFADNLAASAYTASGTWAGTSAQAAFNGGVWNAGGWGTHWIQADMGSLQTLGEVRFTVGVTPVQANTWQKVFLSDTPIGDLWSTLTPLAERSGVGGAVYQPYTLTFAPTTGRYLQIVSHGGTGPSASWVQIGEPTPRTDWVDSGAATTPPAAAVPEPGTYALMLIGLACVGAGRRARRH